MKMTTHPPKGEGYFWWTNLGEHTPTILRVTRHQNRLFADNREYQFTVDDSPVEVTEPNDFDNEPAIVVDGIAYFHGTEFWSGPIELPELNDEFILPDSF
jgi:hypothetical protein